MELKQQIYDQIVKRLDIDEETLKSFDYDTLLFDTGDDRPSLELDSIDALELVTLVYEVWGINVPAEDTKKLYSVTAIADYINAFKG